MYEDEEDNIENMFVVHKGKAQHKKQNKVQEQFQQCRPRSKAPAMRESMISSDEISNMRISSQSIINQEGPNQALTQSITCPVCLNLFTIPYQECQVCSNGFCDPCIQSWWQKNPDTCIYKCQNAEFKQIKRSNTYNALLQTLKTKCPYCQEDQSLSQLQSHIIKYCKEVLEICRYCGQKFKRCEVEKHETQQCKQRIYQCKHCSFMFLVIEQQLHESFCQQKNIQCCHQKCQKLVKRKQLKSHEQSCKMRIVECQWCNQKMTKKEQQVHQNVCHLKKIQCNWCMKMFGVKELLSHQCEKRKQFCRLCQQEVLVSEMEKHKIDCMFQNLVLMKRNNDMVSEENQRLKDKISLLQGIIEQTIESRQSNAIKVMKQMREQDKKIVQKDLLRIDNSLKSVEKLKKQEFASHMKFPHLIQSWCPICRELEKKFKVMMEPLLLSRKSTLQKLAQLQRFKETPK